MKHLFGTGPFAVATSLLLGTLMSCSRTAFDPPQELTSQGMAKADVTDWEQEETLYNECCGEDVTLTYTLHVVLNDNGFHVSSGNINGYGHSSGNAYHGVMNQNGTFQGNNSHMVFNTVVTSRGCGMKVKWIYTVSVDSLGNVNVNKDSFSFECSGK